MSVDEEVPRNNRRGVVIGVAATVLAVAAGAGVWAATTLSGGGRQPDEVVPKTTFAYVKIDLDPAANQKLAARSFFSKIPQLKDKVGGETDDVFDNLLAEVVDDEDLDYRTDIQPWFDKRAAVAAFDEGGKTHVVTALRSKDDAKAKESLDKAIAKAKKSGGNPDDMAYRLTKGYAIVGSKASVAAAVQLAEKESLHDNETYTGDVDRLRGDQVAVGWSDVTKSFEAVKNGFDSAALVPPALARQFTGRIVAGLHLTGDTAEVEGLFLGGALSKAVPAQNLLPGLPADTAAALSINGLGQIVDDALAGLPVDDVLGRYTEGSDLSLDDVLPLLMRETVVAVAPFQGLEDLQAALLSKVDNPAKAKATATRLATVLQTLGVPVKADVSGDTFVLGMPDTYVDSLAKGNGGLGAKPGFTKAMGDLGGANVALYVDVAALSKIAPELLAGAPPGMTFGAVAGLRGTDGFFRLRLVIQ